MVLGQLTVRFSDGEPLGDPVLDSLPQTGILAIEPAHENGSQTHGILELEEE